MPFPMVPEMKLFTLPKCLCCPDSGERQQEALSSAPSIRRPWFSGVGGSGTGLLGDWVVQTDTWTLALASATALAMSFFPAVLVNIWETMPKSQKKFS